MIYTKIDHEMACVNVGALVFCLSMRNNRRQIALHSLEILPGGRVGNMLAWHASSILGRGIHGDMITVLMVLWYRMPSGTIKNIVGLKSP